MVTSYNDREYRRLERRVRTRARRRDVRLQITRVVVLVASTLSVLALM